MRVTEYLKAVKEGKVDITKYTQRVLEETKKINEEYNYFNTISEELAMQQAEAIDKRIKSGDTKGRLLGLPVSVKDCICVKDVESTAGSKILTGYKPPFNATVVQKCIDEGAIIIGKTSQDEFGFGGFSTNVGIGFKIPKNPLDPERVTGGSSGGAAGHTQKTIFAHTALAESTGGSIVNPASFCGVVGICPTYGLISRYGLIDYSNSLDKIGVIGKEVEDCKLMLDIIKGHDSKDSTSFKTIEKQETKGEVKKLGILKEGLEVDEEIKDLFLKKIYKLDFEIKEISLPITKKYAASSYYITALSEASTNLAKYCGMRYGLHMPLEGNFNEYFSKVRSAGFGKEAKIRTILGTFARMAGFREAYYIKAAKTRTMIIQEYKKIFKKFDLLASPTMSMIAPRLEETQKLTMLQKYMLDVLTIGANLAGLPHISVNAGLISGMPSGIMFTANHFEEDKLFQDYAKKTHLSLSI